MSTILFSVENEILYVILSQECNFIANDCYENDENWVVTLDNCSLKHILSSSQLQVKDEESFRLFILRLDKERQSNSSLFEYIDFGNVDTDRMRLFVQQFSLDEAKCYIEYIQKAFKKC